MEGTHSLRSVLHQLLSAFERNFGGALGGKIQFLDHPMISDFDILLFQSLTKWWSRLGLKEVKYDLPLVFCGITTWSQVVGWARVRKTRIIAHQKVFSESNNMDPHLNLRVMNPSL